MSKERAPEVSVSHGLVRHGAGFVLSGGIAFVVDAVILHLLMAYAGFDPIVARIGSISVAMVAGWLSHRRLTFNLRHAPSIAEFTRYAAVAWFSAGVNYLMFAGILLLWPNTPAFVALFIASGLAMFVSYVGMRYAAFRVHTAGH